MKILQLTSTWNVASLSLTELFKHQYLLAEPAAAGQDGEGAHGIDAG